MLKLVNPYSLSYIYVDKVFLDEKFLDSFWILATNVVGPILLLGNLEDHSYSEVLTFN